MRAAILVAACWAVSCGLVHADAAAPRRPGEPAQARGSILRPATIVVMPAGAVQAPDRVVVYVAPEHLRAVLGQLETPSSAETGTTSTLRHVMAAVALAIAILSLPMLLGRKGTGPATAVLLLAGALATAWVAVPASAADIAAPGVRRTTPPGPPRPNTQDSTVRVTPTLEISVKPGLVQPAVQLFYRRP